MILLWNNRELITTLLIKPILFTFKKNQIASRGMSEQKYPTCVLYVSHSYLDPMGFPVFYYGILINDKQLVVAEERYKSESLSQLHFHVRMTAETCHAWLIHLLKKLSMKNLSIPCISIMSGNSCPSKTLLELFKYVTNQGFHLKHKAVNKGEKKQTGRKC